MKRFSSKLISALRNFSQVREEISCSFELFLVLYAEYMRVSNSIDTMTFGAWTTCSLNINYAVTWHLDKGDYGNGLCWIIPFGDYSGGELSLKDFNAQVLIKPCDVAYMRSSHLEHRVEAYTGTRNSIVLFTEANMFFKK